MNDPERAWDLFRYTVIMAGGRHPENWRPPSNPIALCPSDSRLSHRWVDTGAGVPAATGSKTC
jgi:hypothetical protein